MASHPYIYIVNHHFLMVQSDLDQVVISMMKKIPNPQFPTMFLVFHRDSAVQQPLCRIIRWLGPWTSRSSTDQEDGTYRHTI